MAKPRAPQRASAGRKSPAVRASITKRLIVALDVEGMPQATRLATQLRGLAGMMKVGSALFTAVGPSAIAALRHLGFEVFLDLKFHDIPSTVEKSCRAAVAHRVAMLTIHASGQPEMLTAAAAGVAEEARRRRVPKPLVLGVTVLTSVGEPSGSVTQRVLELAQRAKQAGLDGVVASAQEAAAIRQALGPLMAIVCPGIRPSAQKDGDQQRVASPSQALAWGANYLVVGRPITAAADPALAARQMLDEMAAPPNSTAD